MVKYEEQAGRAGRGEGDAEGVHRHAGEALGRGEAGGRTLDHLILSALSISGADARTGGGLVRLRLEIPLPIKLGFVHIGRRSGGERQSVGKAIKEGAWDFDDVVG